MIIEVNSTKADQRDAASDPYGFTEEKPSRKPWVFAGLLAGFALYLRSIYPGSADPASQSGTVAEPDAEQEAPNVAQLPAVEVASQPDDPSYEQAAADAASLNGSGGRIIELLPAADFLSVEATDLVLVELTLPPIDVDMDQSAAPAMELRSANDNGPSGRGTFDDDQSDDHDKDPDHSDPADPDEDSNEPGTDEDDADDEEQDEDETGNRAPRVTGPVCLNDVFGCSAAIIGLGELLRNASDPDGDALSIANLRVSSGTLVETGGGWSFSAAALGPVTITYEITDGALSVIQTTHFDVLRSPAIVGSSWDDTIAGTECADDIDGGCGDDNIDARGGADTIEGGAGDDHIVAGSGNDIVRAGEGNDIVFGGVGKDWISGGKGEDRLFGGEDDDVLFGDEGDDELAGEVGNDLLFGGKGNDRVSGGDGRDKLFGEDGDDHLNGGKDDDVMSGGKGSDVVLAEDGNDTVTGDADQAPDHYDGGKGKDLMDYSAVTGPIIVDLGKGKASGDDIGCDEIAGFEAVATGSGDDEVTGGASCDEISTGDGDDRIEDGGGSDLVEAGAGNDVVKAAIDAVADTFRGSTGHDTLDYSSTLSGIYVDLEEQTATGIEIGTDRVSGFEAIVGGAGDDTFVVVSDAPVSLTGGSGEDVFEFAAASGGEPGALIVHDILDFMVGDRIKISKYEIFERVIDTLEDRFEDIYGDQLEEEDLPIRIRHEQTDNLRQTFIDVDLDRDDIHEMTINIAGSHVLLVVENGQGNQA